MRVWLDLEQTIIAIWQEPELCNVPQIRSFLQRQNVKSVNIFSFAVWNDADREVFNRTMRDGIAQALGVKINLVPTLAEVMKTIFHKSGNLFEPHEFCSVWGKTKAFHDYIYLSGQKGSHTLIDDMVQNMTIQYEDENYCMRFVNVDTLEI